MIDPANTTPILIDAAHAGGAVSRAYFGALLDIEEKSQASDVRTRADTESETAILDVLTRYFPDVNIFSEETGRVDHGSRYTLVIDPLDGSSNFVIGIPDFSVSIALMDGDITLAGVVYSPIIDRTYHASQGQGAFLNGMPIRANAVATPSHATIAYTCGYGTPAARANHVRHGLQALGIKREITLWSPAYDYCLLASGMIEGMINDRNDLYDYAAGKIILREAGCTLTAFDGGPTSDASNQFVASNGTSLHAQLVAITQTTPGPQRHL